MEISVVVSTYNRSQDLKILLEHLKNQVLPAGCDYEVIIINNNSSDDTQAVVEGFIPSYGGKLKYLFEPRQGKPFALNRGIAEARGKLIVLTDDDCTMNNDYLALIHQAFQEKEGTVDFIGGKCLPRWVDCQQPEWFRDLPDGWWAKEFFWGPLAILDYGDEPFVVDTNSFERDGKLFYGANMAIKKEFFDWSGHQFLTPPVEDVELQQHLLEWQKRGLYAPHIRVYHKVSPGRVTPQHYYRWYYLRGTLLELSAPYPRKFYHPLGIQNAMIAEMLKLLAASVFEKDLTQKIYKRCHALFNLGQMTQIARKNIV